MIDWKSLGIPFGLALGLNHCLGPTGSAPPRRAALDAGAGRLAEDIEIVLAFVGRRPVRLAALLGFEDVTTTLVAIDAAKALCAVAIVLKDAAFENVIIMHVISAAAGGRLYL